MYPQFTAHTRRAVSLSPSEAKAVGLLLTLSCKGCGQNTCKWKDVHPRRVHFTPGQRGGSIEAPYFMKGIRMRWSRGKMIKQGICEISFTVWTTVHALVLINTLHARSSFQIGERGKGEGEGQRFELFLTSFSETQRCELHSSPSQEHPHKQCCHIGWTISSPKPYKSPPKIVTVKIMW